TYTSTSTHTTQAELEGTSPNVAGGFGYSTSSTPGSVVGNDDLGVYRSAPIDLGLKTKLANAVITKGGSARVFARSGSVASVSPVEVKRTTQAELEAGVVKTNIITAPNPTLVGDNGSHEYAYNQISAQADPLTGNQGFSSKVDLGIGTSASDHAYALFLYRLSDGTYRLYYTYNNGAFWQLSYRTSANGITGWSARVNLGIGTSASDQAYCPFLYHLADGTYRLYYTYNNGTYDRLSYRTSANGITGWSTRTDLGIGGSGSDHAHSPFLYRLSDGTFRMYYSYHNGSYVQLAYRTSANGTTGWSAQVLLGIGTGISDEAQNPFLYQLSGGTFRLYYCHHTNGGLNLQIVYRTSANGTTGWSGQVLLGIGGASGNLAQSPFLYRLSDGTFRLYYAYHNSAFWQLAYRTQSMEASVSAYESDTLSLSSSAQGNKLPIQASVPANTTLTYKIRSGETPTPDGSWSAWTATTSVVSGLNIFNISALTGKYWRIGLDGTTNGTATWTMGGFSVVPKPANYSSLLEIINPADIQGLAAERYVQYLAFGDTTWNVNDVSLTSKFTAIDLGKRYNIDTLALTDTDDDLYRIHYSLQDEDTYASTTSWIDAGDLTASTTLSYTFSSPGKAMRWFRFNRITENTATSSNPQAKAFLAAQPGSALYKLWQGGSGGGFMTRQGSGTTGYYTINPPSTAIGSTSASNEYRICNGTIAQTKDFIIKFLRQGD
ncbi:hypothetical protein KJ693_11775, partial [bacterium]|nr:hypothetical protein [bacterium]